MNDLQLSALLIVGRQRRRGQQTLDRLIDQTAGDSMEVVVVDIEPELAPLDVRGSTRVRYVRLSPSTPWGSTRAEAVRQARSSVVAFIEDHCPPERDWAEHVIEAHRGPWVAVAYAFRNGSPDSWAMRSAWIAEYGFWADPVPDGPVEFMPGNNVAYKRDALIALGDRLDDLLAVDFNLQEELRRQGHRMYQSSKARASHQSYERFGRLLHANFVYARLMGAIRCRAESWSVAKRVAAGLLAPLTVPPLRLARLAGALRRRSALWGVFILALPVVYLLFSSAALGEGLGYLLGKGSTERGFVHCELQVERSGRPASG